MTPDEKHELREDVLAIMKSAIEGMRHDAPSEKTVERFEKVDNRLDEIKTTLTEFKTATEFGIKEMHKKQDHTNGWINEHEDKYGRMWEDQLEERKNKKEDLREIKKGVKIKIFDLLWKGALITICTAWAGTTIIDKIKILYE